MTVATTSPRVAVEAPPRPMTGSTVPSDRPLGAGMNQRDIVDVWGQDSFPASDAPANW